MFEDNIKMNLKELEWKDMDYVYLVSVETGVSLLWWRHWNFGYHKMRGISYIAKELLGSREWLCFVESVIAVYFVLLIKQKVCKNLATFYSVNVSGIIQ